MHLSGHIQRFSSCKHQDCRSPRHISRSPCNRRAHCWQHELIISRAPETLRFCISEVLIPSKQSRIRGRSSCSHAAASTAPDAAADTTASSPAAADEHDDGGTEEQQKALQKVASGLAKSGNVAGALTMLGSLRREFPGNAHFTAAAARLLLRHGDVGAARQMASEAVALEPAEHRHLQVRLCPGAWVPSRVGAPSTALTLLCGGMCRPTQHLDGLAAFLTGAAT